MKYPIPFDETELKLKSIQVRKDIIEQVYSAGSGHPGGSLSSVEILTVLFNSILRYDVQNPHWEHRDRFILSKAHITPVYYSILCRAGFFEDCELKGFRKLGHFLQGHPKIDLEHGIEVGGGSLGQNLSVAVGIALGLKKRAINDPEKLNNRIFDLSSEGELQEGSMWEAIMSASQYKLNNLCIIVDYNRLQIDGKCGEVMEVAPLDKKFEAFNWNTLVINGHNLKEIYEAFQTFEKLAKGEEVLDKTSVNGQNLDPTKPTAIICITTKGKGISFMENVAGWHGKAPNQEEKNQAIAELEAEENKIKTT